MLVSVLHNSWYRYLYSAYQYRLKRIGKYISVYPYIIECEFGDWSVILKVSVVLGIYTCLSYSLNKYHHKEMHSDVIRDFEGF